VSAICASRDTTVILNNASWRVKRGEHWAILGANGSGKTSLLSALTVYLTPTAGTIEVLGERYGETDWRELRKSAPSCSHQRMRSVIAASGSRDSSPGLRR
jgi:iron complex transport system ATP-binding protein